MKRIIKSIGILLMMLVVLPMSFSQTDDVSSVDAGLTPDSPLYFLDTLQEEISLFVTFNDEKRASKSLEYAEEKLAELDVSTNQQGLTKAKERLNKHLSRASESDLSEESREVVDERVTDITSRETKVLNRLLDNLPSEEGKKGILEALDNIKDTGLNSININNETFDSLRERFTTEFEGSTFSVTQDSEVDGVTSETTYYIIQDGEFIKLSEIPDTIDYEIQVTDREKLEEIAQEYQETGEVDLNELNSIVDVPTSLKTKAVGLLN